MTGIRYSIGLPITSSIIETSQVSIESNLSYSKHLNLCYAVINSKERITQAQSYIRDKKDLSPTHLIRLHMLIESSLYTALSINVLIPPDNSYINPHYSSYLLRGGSKIMPPSDYLDAMAMGYIKSWGTEYGSLLYAVHMTELYDSYLSPSQLEHMCSSYYLSSPNPLIDSLLKEVVIYKYEDEESSDVDLYNLSISPFYNLSDLNVIYGNLTFISSFIPKLMQWFLSESSVNNSMTEYLKNWASTLLSHAIDESNSKDLAYLFMHQMIDKVWYDLYPTLISLRTLIPESNDSIEGNLIKDIREGIKPSNDSNQLTRASIMLTREFCAPGGINLFYLLISSALLNKAYILTDPIKEPLTLSNDLLSNPDREAKYKLSKRVYRLLYLAGYVLKKCSLPHMRVFGGNLILLAGQQLPSRDNSKDLLT